MECPRCGEYAREKCVVTDTNKGSVMLTRLRPPKTLAGVVLKGGAELAKHALSKTYQCSECGHRFRKWLT